MSHDPRLTRLAIRYLGLRSRSQHELENYLHRKLASDQTSESISEVIEYLKTIQLIDDSHFAQEYALSLLKQGKGPIIIKYLLQQKGLSSEVIDRTVSDLDPIVIKVSAMRLAHKRLLHTHDDISQPLGQAKLSQYLYSRGFPPSVARPVIDEMCQQAVE